MSQEFTQTIEALEAKRGKIDDVIKSLRELNGEAPVNAGGAVRAKKTKSAKPTGAKRGPQPKSGGTRDLVIAFLSKGPARGGAVAQALHGKVKAPAVSAMLNYLKSKGEVRKNADDATYELVKG